MELIPNPLAEAGVKLIKPRIFADERGYFFESYNAAEFSKQIGPYAFCQDNQSLSRGPVLRGLHYQLNPNAQTKLVRVITGRIWDVAVDIRSNSRTFKKWFGVELSEENQLQLLVPKGFAHGFVVLSDSAVVSYKVDAPYSKMHDRGIRFDDPELAISWPMHGEILLSQKDRELPFLANAETFN